MLSMKTAMYVCRKSERSPPAGKTPRQIEDAIARAAVDRNILPTPEIRVAYTDQHADLRPLQIGDQVVCKTYELEQPGQFFSESVVVDENGELPVLHLGRIRGGRSHPDASCGADRLQIRREGHTSIAGRRSRQQGRDCG